jgi:hypothetical protein
MGFNLLSFIGKQDQFFLVIELHILRLIIKYYTILKFIQLYMSELFF